VTPGEDPVSGTNSDRAVTPGETASTDVPRVVLPGKLPLKGLSFDREALAKAAKRAMARAHREGRSIDWEEARKLGYLWLLQVHYPRAFGYKQRYGS